MNSESENTLLLRAPPVYSPAETMFVRRRVFLKQGGELQQGQLLQQIHL